MSTKIIQSFLEALINDTELRESIKNSQSVEEVRSIIAKAGFVFKREDILQYIEENINESSAVKEKLAKIYTNTSFTENFSEFIYAGGASHTGA